MSGPRIAEALLRGFIADPDLADAVLGDLTEEWSERAESDGVAPARAWYWGQVLRSVPHLLREWWLQESPVRVLRTLGRVVLVLLLAISLATVTCVAMLIAAGGAPGQPGPDVARAMVVAGSAWAGVAGFFVARRPTAPMVSAVLLALSWLPTSLLAAPVHPSPGPPDWFPVLFPTLLFALTVVGGAVATMLRGPRRRKLDARGEADPSPLEETMKTDRTAIRLAARPLLAVAAVLAVPLVAMQFTREVNWTVFDFVFMGVLVFGTVALFELARTKVESTAYRLAAGVALAAAFLLVWVNGAVGIIGNSANDANLMYAVVLAVGIGGAIGAGFEPRGLARALVATALAQVAVGAIALIAGLGSAWHVVGLTGMFGALFVGSALLFRRAAARRAPADARTAG